MSSNKLKMWKEQLERSEVAYEKAKAEFEAGTISDQQVFKNAQANLAKCKRKVADLERQ